MRYWAAFVAVAMLTGPCGAFAGEDPGPCTFRDTVRLRDGGAHALFTRHHLEVSLYGTAAHTTQRTMRYGDIDYRCDGH